MTSPGTSSLAGTTLSSPSRSTRAVGAVMFFSASSAFAAFFSCTTPTVALSAMTTRMTIHSASPSGSGEFVGLTRYITSENAAAMMRMMTITSVSCSQIMRQTLFGFFCRRSFLPYFARRAAASASESPSSLVSSSRAVSSTVSECHGLGASSSLPTDCFDRSSSINAEKSS